MMGTSIAALNRGEIQVAGFVLRRNGIEIEGKPTFDEWQEAMQYVECAATASMWWHGDMLNYGEATYGDLASEEDGDGKYDYKTLRNAKYVAQAVPLSRRRDNLSFGHHEVVAPLTPEQQDEWLSRAADDGMSRSELRKATADARAADALEEVPLPSGKYSVIYADPPWRYDFSVSDSRKIENHYPTMEVDDICRLDIQSLAADKCVLFLWGTSPKLIEAFTVINSWGFDYKTCMVWRKDKIGMGYYARQQHELLLIATKGDPKPPTEDSRPPSVIDGVRTKHSRKPEVFYELIEKMYPKSKRLELFCRVPRKGWKIWGNEVQSDA